ncbi:protein of unknown function DUF1015 [Syntrophotalea carbinolica DSM 2380]|uniref:DUF1015 domain-containing protein n=1 Tax=Syntrophotalea carbinolica (strain DSM 2380 / NBRC 103641 / GraBd1) TaxID=338963 RepID=Q3A2L5_SYNC1|nr:DUF1015 domain-containing protein [Syntrophotalea carbinolica]ABA89392.1 protein of unknown function DUF1015 [Syntrophotalea carbinolica DSM 2380]
MAKIAPFRAVRYNLEKIQDPTRVTAPPYDVISSQLQEELYQRSPFNLVRLILGKIEEGDNEGCNRYVRAAGLFRQWMTDDILVRDMQPSIYLYDEEYQAEGLGAVVRKGFMALARLEDFATGMVKPHEKTLSGPKADRLQLTKACEANFSPIFGLYSDPCCVQEALTWELKKRTPDLEVTDDDGVIHRLWQVTDDTVIQKVCELLENKPVFIADGHHRYETALNYRDFRRGQCDDFSGKELFNYVLMYFANMEDQGMLIFPTHRLVYGLQSFRLEPFLSELSDYFEVEAHSMDPNDAESRREVRNILQKKGEARPSVGLFAGGRTTYFLTLKDEHCMDAFFDEKASKALRTLDVSILHRLVLEKMLHITPEAQEQQTNLKYIKNFDEPFSLVQSGQYQMAFLMNSTRMTQVRDVANAGEKMPQKSTYFYPKLLSGLVINQIARDEMVED